jgi:hypothetical protein
MSRASAAHARQRARGRGLVEAARTITGNRESRGCSCQRLRQRRRWSLDWCRATSAARPRLGAGRGREPQCASQVLLADGDRSTMTIEPLPGTAP